MITHIAVFRWKDHVAPADVEGLCAALSALPDRIPALIGYRFGPDLGLRVGNGDFAVVAQVPDEASVAGYLDHPAHQDIVRRYTSVMAAERIVVQFATD